jgi:hypothetical protein
MEVYGKGNRGPPTPCAGIIRNQVPEVANAPADLREGMISAGTKPQHPCGMGEGNREALRSQGASAGRAPGGQPQTHVAQRYSARSS